MGHNRIVRVLALALLLVHADGATADTTTLQGAVATDDTTILQGFPSDNFGASGSLDIGRHFGSARRSLLRFDLSSLAGQTVESASLRLTLVNTFQAGFTTNFGGNVDLHTVSAANADWIEGTAVTRFDPDAGFATWSQKAEGSASWSGGGGLGGASAGYSASPVATFNSQRDDGAGTKYTVTFADVSFLQQWIDDPSSNGGLLLRAVNLENHPSSFSFLLRFGQSGQLSAADQPVLTICTEDAAPNEPPTAESKIVVSGDSNITNDLGPGAHDNRTFFRNVLGNGSTVLVQGGTAGDAPLFETSVNRYYDGLTGVTSSMLSGSVVECALSGVDLFVSVMPATDYSASEAAAMSDFLVRGGSIYFLGEHGGAFTDVNDRINSVLAALGSSMYLTNDSIDGATFLIASGSQVASHPLTSGVDALQYFRPSGVNGGTALFFGTTGRTFVAVQEAAPNEPPTANAGQDKSIHAGQTVNLDGTGSLDDQTATEDLGYAWTFAVVPAGSTTSLTDAATATPSFVADVPGTYDLQLIVMDQDGAASDPDTVVISSENVAPAADAGMAQVVVVGETTMLSGVGSSDPDEDGLTYAWTLDSAPAGSTAAIVGETTASPSIIPDVEGAYTISLVVHDGFEGSDPVLVTVTAIGPVFAQDQLLQAGALVSDLPDEGFDAKGHRKSIANRYSDVIAAIQADDVAEAIKLLNKSIERTDGCTLRGSPDPKGKGQPFAADHVTDCIAQFELYALLSSALDAITP